MEELRNLLNQLLVNKKLSAILSNSKNQELATKVKIRSVEIKNQVVYQETLYKGTQVFHKNYNQEEIVEKILEHLTDNFRQGEIEGDNLKINVLVSKKGKMTIKKKGGSFVVENESHNREKKYILKEGMVVDFLVGLGVSSEDGHINKAKYDKFRQINRYLEFIEDILDKLPKDKTLKIIDFGCGKSYLTFAMYYYLHELQGRNIEVTGLDLKKDVINNCNKLAENLNYDNLHFEMGDIATYEGCDSVDMVVSLHACDTATDYAIEKAVKWGAKVIFAVPCCQHEINKQIKCDELKPVLKYGIIKERISALITDALRADMLEEQGYDTQILEFIDMEHTPKNLLIRAVKNDSKSMKPKSKSDDLDKLMEFLNVSPTLKNIL